MGDRHDDHIPSEEELLEALEMPDRRGPDRRKNRGVSPTGVERRRGPGRRLSDFLRAAEDGELTKEQFLFVMAIDAFKKANEVMYPNWTDVLEVVRLLGYRKTMPSELEIPNAEDWREPPNAPADVRTDRQKQRDAQARGEAA
jgi:hypothetical protein